MAWTYDPALLTDKDRVRFKTGDTVEADPLFQDEEIQALLNDGEDVVGASISLIQSLVRRYARKVDTQSGDEKKESSRLYTQYKEQLDELRAESPGGASVMVGAITGRTLTV